MMKKKKKKKNRELEWGFNDKPEDLPAATKLHSDSASAILPLHSAVPILSFQFQTSTSGHSYLSPSLSLISFLLLSSSFCSRKLYLFFT
jgi:hypothetical protein